MKVPYPLLLCIFLFSNCGDQQSAPTTPSAPAQEAALSGTAKMVQLLGESYDKIDPMTMEYFNNTARAQQYRQNMEQSQSVGDKMTNKIFYGYELIGAGKNEEAVVQFEELLQAATGSGATIKPDLVYTIKRMLALAYIRLGEATNCIQRFNPQSCLMPIEGDGIYAVTEASRAAIRLYEEMLPERPDDYETMWMLNFAYMTLGEYPEKVPAKWLIPEKAFRSDYQMPAFKNIANDIGVATVGLSGGACVDDFNNDGLLDIFASSWGASDQLRYFVNNGDGSFSEKTKEAGLTGLTGGLNTQHADYNNDGWTDVLVLRGAWYKENGNIPNSLLKNNGDGTFTDVTEEAGMLSFAPTQAAAFADFDNDGWLDLFIGNESATGFSHVNEFYMNNQDGTFTNRINELGLGNFKTFIKGCAAGDIDNDGWTDLFISIQGGPNLLLRNKGLRPSGFGISFENITANAKISDPLVSFPSWMFDFNNDGWEDIFVAGFGERGKRVAAHLAAMNYRGEITDGMSSLYINNQDGTFTDIAQQAGMDEAMFVMGSNYGDIDNDGWLDLYLGTGAPGFTAVVPNKMFRNNKGKSVQDVTTSGGFGHVQKGHGVGFGDFDNDGDQDIFAVIGGAFEGDIFSDAFFLNPIGQDKSWVNLKLVGTQSNTSAIGARVKVVTVAANGRERTIHATVSIGSSFGGNSLQLEMGLDDAVKIKSIEVKWPNREQTVQVLQNVELNKFVKITEGQNEVEYVQPKSFNFPT
ncbi:MAG: CRTAC1 family protein [Bacteroidota bacterium]